MTVLSLLWAFLASDSTGKQDAQSGQSPNIAKRFAEDDRGVMMVVGAIAGAFLIGSVWYIWGVGQAAVFRENMQSAADATAYQVSAYDARGMNIIAMINLIMSVVLTVYVVIRFLQAIFVAVNIISCIFGAIFNPVCDATTAAEPTVTNLVDKAAKIDAAILTALSVTESGISILWPVFASGTSMSVSNDYAPTVDKTVGIGSSLSPIQGLADAAGQVAGSAINFGELKEEGDKRVSVGNIKKQFGKKGGVFCNFSGKFMLPTQNDAYANLCARAGANVAYAIGGLVNLFAGSLIGGAIESFFDNTVAPIVGILVGKFEAFFCEDDSGMLESIAKSLLSGSGEDTAQGGLDKKCDEKAQNARNQAQNNNGNAGGDIAGATANCKAALSRAKNSSKGSKDSPTGAFAEACSKTLYSGSAMLGQDFQNWGFSFGHYSDKSGAAVSTANGREQGGVGAEGADGADMQVAQSEFYYEPKTSSETKDAETSNVPSSFSAVATSVADGKGALNSGLDNYMWNMRWRARLRRVKAPSVNIGSMLTGILTTAGKKASGTLPIKNPAEKWVVNRGIGKAIKFINGKGTEAGEATGGVVTIGHDNAAMVH